MKNLRTLFIVAAGICLAATLIFGAWLYLTYFITKSLNLFLAREMKLARRF